MSTGISLSCSITALEWWWANTGSELPDPALFPRIIDEALLGREPAVVEWWWTRFLEHRTPEHTFGSGSLEVGRFTDAGILDWHWRLFHESPVYFAHHVDSPHGLVFRSNVDTPLPVFQWAIEKCAALDDHQKLSLTANFFEICIMNGRADVLDLALRSSELLDATWPLNMVRQAMRYAQVNVLEWWYRNQDALPPQDAQDSGTSLYLAAQIDAAGVIAWWHERFPISERHWSSLRHHAVTCNAHHVQLLLRDRPALLGAESEEERHESMVSCVSRLTRTAPFTFDYMRADLAPADWLPIPKRAYKHLTILYWCCQLANITVDSLLPLAPRTFGSQLWSGEVIMLEWWLQAHLAAGHHLVLPSADKLYDNEEESLRWVYDVTVTRKLVVFVESQEGSVVYTAPPLPE